MNFNFTKLTRLKKLLVLMILFVVAISCSKFDETPLELNKISFSTNKETNAVKDWYNKNHKRSDQNPFSTLKPIWDSMTKSFIDGRVVYEVKLENPEKVVSTINFISDSKYKRIDDKTLEKVAKQSKISLLFFENPKTSGISGATNMTLEST